jgi:hypothetical protein
VLSLIFLSVSSLLLLIGLAAHFYVKDQVLKLFFSVSAQPQLLEVESPKNVGIFKPNSVTFCVLV